MVTLLKVNLNDQGILFEERYNDKDRVLILEFHTEADASEVYKIINNNMEGLRKMGLKLEFDGKEFNSYFYKKVNEMILSEEDSAKDKKAKTPKIIYGVSNYSSKKKGEFLKSFRDLLPSNFSFEVRISTYSIYLELPSE